MTAQLYGETRVELGDESWTFAPDDLKVSQLVVLEREFGGSIDELVAEANDRAPVACQILVWWLRGMTSDRLMVDFAPRRLRFVPVTNPDGTPYVDPKAHELDSPESQPAAE